MRNKLGYTLFILVILVIIVAAIWLLQNFEHKAIIVGFKISAISIFEEYETHESCSTDKDGKETCSTTRSWDEKYRIENMLLNRSNPNLDCTYNRTAGYNQRWRCEIYRYLLVNLDNGHTGYCRYSPEKWLHAELKSKITAYQNRLLIISC